MGGNISKPGGELLSTLKDLKEIYGICLGVNGLVFLTHAWPNRSEKYYDLTGSITFSVATIYSWLRSSSSSPFSSAPFSGEWKRKSLASLCLLVWCNRLGFFLWRRIMASGEDRRFAKMRNHFPMFLFAWFMQANWNFIVGLPIYLLNIYSSSSSSAPSSSSSLHSTDIFGFSFWVIGFLLEVIADKQKRNFSSSPANNGKFITEGLWAISRHPNYLGEIIMWCSLGFVAYSFLSSSTSSASSSPSSSSSSTSPQRCSVPGLALFSPIFTFLLLRFLSGIPLLERSGLKRWGHLPEYQSYLERTPLLLPKLF